MTTSLKLAWRLAFSRDVRQRWRQLSVVIASLVSTFVLLLGIAVWQAARQSDDRIELRSPVVAARPVEAIVAVSPRGIVVSGHSDLGQFPVIWLHPRPGHDFDPAAVPPGLRALPAAGEAVLSAALVQRGLTAEDFGLRTSTAGTGLNGAIGDAGLATSSEGWIYARPPAGRTLGSGGTLLPLRGYLHGGPATENRLSQETFPDLPSGTSALVGMLWLVLGPALYLALGASRSLSELRLQRSATLFRLGIAQGRIRTVLAVETALLAATGTAAGVVTWLLAGQSWRSLPLTGTTLQPSALALAAGTVLVIVVALVSVMALVGMTGDVRGRVTSTRRRQPKGWHALPLAASIVAMTASRFATPMSAASASLLFAGVILCLASLPLAVPFLVQRAGTVLSRRTRPAAWLAGRRLVFDSMTFAKPAAAVAALVLIAGAAFAIYGRITDGGSDSGRSGPVDAGRVGQVNWRDERPGDVDWAVRQLSGMLATPTGTDSSGSSVAVVHSCWEVADTLGTARSSWCSSASDFTVRGVDDFAAMTRFTPRVGPAGTRVGPAGTQLDGFNLLLLDDTPIDQREVMRALAPRLPAINTTRVDGTTRFVPVGWLIAGWLLASMVLCGAVIREVGDRTLFSLSQDRKVLALGLSRREINAVHRWSVLTPVVVAAPVGYGAAVVFAVLGHYLGFTINYLGRITGVAASVWGMALATLLVVLRLDRRIEAR